MPQVEHWNEMVLILTFKQLDVRQLLVDIVQNQDKMIDNK